MKICSNGKKYCEVCEYSHATPLHRFYMNRIMGEALTFDDVLLVPCYSEVTPDLANVSSFLTPSIPLPVPFISAPMDTVTESTMAIATAIGGGVGVIHKNMSIDDQRGEIEKVKNALGEKENDANFCTDEKGRLIVGGAIGVGANCLERANKLLDAGADFLVLDSAHGHSANVIRAVGEIRRTWPNCQLVAGNVVTAEGAEAIFRAGADTVKVGIGAGSICTTRIVAGVGMPQLSAIMEVAKIAARMGKCIIADGGIKYSGDAVKAIAAGAHAVMCGNLFATCEESPGESICENGKLYKAYRGMGSVEAMREGSADRYSQRKTTKLVPEGIVGRVPLEGSVRDVLFQLVGGLRSGMGYMGAANVKELQAKARFVKINGAGLRESHVHDVTITKESPNYKIKFP